jgi:hypothetical protein
MTNNVSHVGFFAELPHGHPDGPSLRAAARPTGDPFEAQLVAYLRSGRRWPSPGRW